MPTKPLERKPDWLKINLKTDENFKEIKSMMRSKTLHTVCEEAKCPNIHECWANRTATFMILGDICTRACRFCAVKTGLPTELDLQEPERVARSTTTTFWPVSTSSCATDNPAIPAPTTTVSQLFLPSRRGASGATTVLIHSDLVRSPLTFILGLRDAPSISWRLSD